MSTADARGRTVRQFKPYPAYKDSGVEWLAGVPTHWQVKRVKRLCLVRRGASPRPIDDPIYFDDEGEYAWVRIADVTASERYLEATTQRLSALGESKSVALQPGELFVSIAATVGKPIITKIKCCIHDGFVYFVGLREQREFLYYLLSCGEPYKGLGKLGTQPNLNTDTIGDISLPVPSRPEQQAMVQFLDRETARIDALVAKKKRLIELLQEKRTALITRAVTKGLDPTVPMKDSGLEWLGEIPAHWEAGKLRRFWSVIDCKHRTATYVAEGVPIVSTTEVKPGRLVLDGPRRVTMVDFDDLTAGGRRPRRGDLVYSRNASLGSAAYVETEEPFCMGQDVCLITSDSDHLYLGYQLNSPAVHSQMEAVAVGSTSERINVAQIKDYMVAFPPAAERRVIAGFLDRETARIDALVAKVREAIDRLKEFRTALISAAVTGKIDVREEAV